MVLFKGHQVSHDLAGMRQPRECIDNRNGRVAREFQQHLVFENADHDGVDIARQNTRRIGDGLAAAELHFLAGQHDHVAAELTDRHIERHPRARRGLIEDHCQRLCRRTVRRRAAYALLFHRPAGVDHAAQFARRDIDEIQEMPDLFAHTGSSRRLLLCFERSLDVGGRPINAVDALGDLGFADDQRRQQPHHVVAGGHRQQVLGAQRVDKFGVWDTWCAT